MGYIYIITNQLNNKKYVGQTSKVNPQLRYNQHKYCASHPETGNGNISYLHRAMAKYGIENFSFEIIEEVDNSLLDEKECYWIKALNTLMPNGYNMTEGGEGTKGFSRIQTEEEKEIKRQAMKNFYKNHPEEKEKLKERTTELWKNEKYRQKVTEGVHRFYQDEANRNKFKGENNPMYGKKHTQESLEKMKKHCEQYKLKIAQLDKDSLEIIQIFDGIRDAEAALNVSHGWISKAARQNKIAYRYRWKFL